jgi:xylulokinase
MYIGIDLGTSGVKAILLNEQGDVVASHTEKLTVSRPHPLWSEQDPEQWWQATDTAMKALGAQHSLRDVKALGIAGQMHGATLLDKSLQVLRPAILWNDGRCGEECQLLEEKVSASRQITGNLICRALRRRSSCGCSATRRRCSARSIKCCCRRIICVCG